MIYFHQEDCSFVPKGKTTLRSWLNTAIREEGKVPGEISLIFCSDEYLNKINKDYLDHTELTDIITFDYCVGRRVSGDIFISVDRVRENAVNFGVTEPEELRRVMVHGVLHLCGYADKKPSDKKTMTEKEDHYLKKLSTQLV